MKARYIGKGFTTISNLDNTPFNVLEGGEVEITREIEYYTYNGFEIVEELQAPIKLTKTKKVSE
jgi:hypothetical protein